ncbi:MAG: flavin reductase family protein [Steroidobacteraceae bacterium]
MSGSASKRMNLEPFNEREFRAAAGQFCTGVTVVTGFDADKPCGFAAQSFVSVSLDPPLVAICVAQTSSTWPRMRRGGRFCINILAADQQQICSLFGRSGDDRFASCLWNPGPAGLPVLAGILGFIECELTAEHLAGDHTMAVGAVLSCRIIDPERGPLLFFRSGYGKFAPANICTLGA